jgi:hypothetical protein
VFFVQTVEPGLNYALACDPETGFTQFIEDPWFGRVPSSPFTVTRSGPIYNDACLTMYFNGPVSDVVTYCINGGEGIATLASPASSVVAPVGYGPYIYFTSGDLLSIQIYSLLAGGQKRILIPGVIVGQPCLGAYGQLIVTYDGQASGKSSGCLAIGTDGTINWTHEVAGSRPLTAAAFSQGWVGYFGTTAGRQPFVELFANPG